MFPFLDLKAQYESIQEEIEAAVAETLASGQFVLGPQVRAFETEIARWNASRFAVGCASGSDALLVALMALDVGPGDEVITAPFTFVATLTAILRLGAKPVFADIDPVTFNLDPEQVRGAVTSRTRVILPVHLYGYPADLAPIMQTAEEHRIAVVEDAAQAIGAEYHGQRTGNIGAIGCFSFYPTKNLSCAGDGGLNVTNDERLAERLRVLGRHGSRTTYRYDVLGINSRLDEIQAAILRVKLRKLDEWTAVRRRKAEVYGELFSQEGLDGEIRTPHVPDYAKAVYHQYTIRISRRDELREYLQAHGIPSGIYYPAPLHLEPAFSHLGHKGGDYPESERAAREVLSLPIYPELSIENQAAVVEAIASFYRGL